MNRKQQRQHAEDYGQWISDLWNEAQEAETPERRVYLQSKYDAIHADLVAQARPIIGDIAEKKFAAWLWALVSTEAIIQGNYMSERMHANMQTAHNQLKNWR